MAAGASAGIGLEALPPVRKAIGSGFETKNQDPHPLVRQAHYRRHRSTVVFYTLYAPLAISSLQKTYFQSAFRVQSPWSIRNPSGDNPNTEEILKPICFVFDFAPTRALRQVSDYGIGLSPNELNPENAVKDLVSFLPVLQPMTARISTADRRGRHPRHLLTMAGTSAICCWPASGRASCS